LYGIQFKRLIDSETWVDIARLVEKGCFQFSEPGHGNGREIAIAIIL
jgi:hypothetical protein